VLFGRVLGPLTALGAGLRDLEQRSFDVRLPRPKAQELAAITDRFNALAAVGLAVNIVVIGILYFLFGQVLGPLTAVTRGLADLEQRNYKVRLPRPHAQELAAFADRFNALAQALEAARAENERLNHRLITAQDDERRRTALELHDEVGPSLFGLKANAGSLATAAAALPYAPARAAIAERARDILAIVDHLQAVNRSLLTRLRPMALGHVPLTDVLADMIRERARQSPQIAFPFAAGKLKPSYGDAIDLTIYRCVQEGLTNAVRHAQADTVRVTLDEAGAPTAARLELAIEDDGRGIDPRAPAGFGLRGMQERVRALGGECAIAPAAGGGTRVAVVIPLPNAPEG